MEEVDRNNDNCSKCGQWYMEDKEHECTTDAPLVISAPLGSIGFDLDKLVFGIVGCDSGAGLGYRDYQMEMCSAKDRREVVAALKGALSEEEFKTLRMSHFGENDTCIGGLFKTDEEGE